MIKDVLALFNYYRNYHIYYDQIEKQQDIFGIDMTFLDNENVDEYAEFLIPESEIADFWDLNEAFVATFKNFVFGWACKLAKSVKVKFSRVDPNLEPKPRMPRPKDKTVKEGEVRDVEEEEEED